MSDISTPKVRTPFFPKSRGGHTDEVKHSSSAKPLRRNDVERKEMLEGTTREDAKVKINDAVKDFARIKQAVDSAPDIDKSDKIAALKDQINNGTYEFDYDGLAEKILTQEF